MRTLLQAVVLAGLCAGLVPAATPAQVHGAGNKADAFAASLAAFEQRVKDYISVRDKVARTLPEVKETGDPAKISARERALGIAVAMERRTARAGDVFGGLTPYLQRILADDWKMRAPADRKALFEEIPPSLKLVVNQPYPTTIPLITVPAKLLAALPALPEALEYRLVDRRLLLRDRDANLIVDVIVGVPPARGK
jgi:hypothetical protein